MGAFTQATAVTPRSADSSVYDVDLDPSWTIAGKPNGGYLLAVLGRAAVAGAQAAGAGHVHPLASTATYVSSPDTGPAEVHVEVLRSGRSVSQVKARLMQGGTVRTEGTFTLGTLNDDTAAWWGDNPPAPMPAPDKCLRIPSIDPVTGGPLALMDEIELDMDPAGLGFAMGAPGGTGSFTARLRFAHGHQPDPVSLLFVADALPPVTLDLGLGAWVPTLELTVYVRAIPAPGELTVRQHARHIGDGLMDEVCEVWDSRGRLVAQATQLAAPRIPDRPAADRAVQESTNA